VALIGSLEQFDLANILRRLEVFSKTGLLVVKRGDIWIEFYFRQGQLVCTGPNRANTKLVDRLFQAKLLPAQSLPQVMAAVNPSESDETQVALALINAGYLSREALRAWRSHETSQILQTVCSWPVGEIYFEEDCLAPANCLLVALSVTALLDALPASTPRPASAGAPSTNEPVSLPSNLVSAQPTMATPALSDTEPAGKINAAQFIEQVPSLASPASGLLSASQLVDPSALAGKGEPAGTLSASQLIDDLPFSAPGAASAASFVEDTPPPAFAQAAAPAAIFGAEINVSSSNQISFLPPQPVHNPLPPARIDTSFMTPELVLVPVDLSSLRERNPQVQLTPDQWRLFALIDGQTPLQKLCQALMAPVDQVCTVAGELIAIGLVMPLTPVTGAFNVLSAPSVASMTNGVAPSVQPSAPLPTWAPQQPMNAAPAPFTAPVETQSQWGNGNNGATFMVGGGWVLTGKQPAVQPGQSGAMYAHVGGYR
jgi:hypothetical protein